jgi:hypothetical protein
MDDKKEKYNLIPTSNPMEKKGKSVIGLLSYQKKGIKQSDPANNAVSVLLMDDTGLDRSLRKKEILNYFPDNCPDGARTVENIVNKTTGLSKNQLNKLLNHMRLKDFRDSEKFIDSLNDCVQKAWLEEF